MFKMNKVLFTVSLMGTLITDAPVFAAATSIGVTAVTVGDEPKYGPDLKFDWVHFNAPKGGTLALSDFGTFDSLNPYAVKNNADDLILELVFQTLTTRSSAEAIGAYSGIATTMDIPADGMSITFHLNPKAKWSDGKPLTTKDVEFSFKIMTSEKATPFYRLYYADVKPPVVIDAQTIRFDFKVKNRELPVIIAQLPVLPKHVYGIPGKDFVKSFAAVKPIGSGPYIVKSYEFGKQVIFERNKQWWASDEPFARGSYNFETIHHKYYKDRAASVEGFKAGDFDVLIEMTSRAWAVDHAGEKWDKNWIRKETWEHHENEGSQGFPMNLRRPLFQDRMVRKALAIAFDFDWTNETLFYKLYKPSSSFFNNSELNAQGLPDAKELALLTPLKDKLPPEVFTEPKGPLGAGLSGKQRLSAAMKLLKDAGWELKDGVMQKNGQRLEFTIVETDAAGQRFVDPFAQSLAKIGVKMNVKIDDQANYMKRMEKFDFDMTSARLAQSDSPGNEQRDYWHSSSANSSGSYNVFGLKDPAIDTLVDKLIQANTREELVTATRALDRALWFNYIQVPNWYSGTHRVSYWSSIGIPEKKPPFYDPTQMLLRYAWYDADRAAKLKNAMQAGVKL